MYSVSYCTYIERTLVYGVSYIECTLVNSVSYIVYTSQQCKLYRVYTSVRCTLYRVYTGAWFNLLCMLHGIHLRSTLGFNMCSTYKQELKSFHSFAQDHNTHNSCLLAEVNQVCSSGSPYKEQEQCRLN